VSAPVEGHPPTRTFKPRRRRMSPTLADARARLAPRWTLAEAGPVLTDAPGGPDVVEIGFGHGEALLAYAEAHRDRRIVGIEVHTPGVAKVLAGIERLGLTNLQVVEGDALVFLDRVAPASLQAVHVLFPDPWPKARQQPRRLIRPDVVAVLADRLAPGGRLHLATDDAGYAARMDAVCGADPTLRGGPWPAGSRPGWRTVTRYEARAVEAGRVVVDLTYERI
jgi:tRNA (guanine-N7-)-methyltransferase